MKEKILELIHKELENVGGDNIFHDCGYSWYDGPPYKKNTLEIKSNCDSKETIDVDLLDFALKFEDGEPSIKIYTITNYTTKLEPYKTKYFGFKKFTSIITSYIFTTKITCGHISFDLSDDENAELIKLTKESYSKYLSLKDKARNKEVSKKIKKRLKKYQNKLGK
jgi:hypothetical protein